jgi:hypothetical protein
MGAAAEGHRQPQRQTRELAVALSSACETAQTTRRATVPSPTRLDCSSDRRAARASAYLLEDRAATRSFSHPGQEAVPGSVAAGT